MQSITITDWLMWLYSQNKSFISAEIVLNSISQESCPQLIKSYFKKHLRCGANGYELAQNLMNLNMRDKLANPHDYTVESILRRGKSLKERLKKMR